MVLVWGVRKEGLEEQKSRARWLFNALEREKAQVVVSAVSVSEYLSPVDPKKHRGVLAAISGHFVIQPFDVRCTSLAASLWIDGKSTREMSMPDSRKCLRADCLIVACAKIAGVNRFYSGDAGCRKLAERIGLQALDLPTQPDHLFEFDDLPENASTTRLSPASLSKPESLPTASLPATAQPSRHRPTPKQLPPGSTRKRKK